MCPLSLAFWYGILMALNDQGRAHKCFELRFQIVMLLDVLLNKLVSLRMKGVDR